eukprot:6268583-Prorocentrum_lima.AAC.1
MGRYAEGGGAKEGIPGGMMCIGFGVCLGIGGVRGACSSQPYQLGHFCCTFAFGRIHGCEAR